MKNNFISKNPYINLYEKASSKSKVSSQMLYGEKFKILLLSTLSDNIEKSPPE